MMQGGKMLSSFFERGGADDVARGILMGHHDVGVRCYAKQLFLEVAHKADGGSCLQLVVAVLRRRMPQLDQKGVYARQALELLSDLTQPIQNSAPQLLAEVDQDVLQLLEGMDSDCSEAFLEDVMCFCEAMCKRHDFAKKLVMIGMVKSLYNNFLMQVPDDSGLASEPLCQEPASRKAAWALLLALVRQAPEHSTFLVDNISAFLKLTRVSKSAEGSEDWNVCIAVSRRRGMPYIGMRNPGARCYINAMVQQLWGVEAFRECINNASPAVDDSDAPAGRPCSRCNRPAIIRHTPYAIHHTPYTIHLTPDT